MQNCLAAIGGDGQFHGLAVAVCAVNVKDVVCAAFCHVALSGHDTCGITVSSGRHVLNGYVPFLFGEIIINVHAIVTGCVCISVTGEGHFRGCFRRGVVEEFHICEILSVYCGSTGFCA